MSKITFSIGGVHPADSKFAANRPIEVLPLPEVVYVSMAQHLGAPAKPVVEVGAQVKAGQVIAEPGGFISAFVSGLFACKVSRKRNSQVHWPS